MKTFLGVIEVFSWILAGVMAVPWLALWLFKGLAEMNKHEATKLLRSKRRILMGDIYKYINWDEYWTNEVKCQIENLEDYEPVITDTDKEEIIRFLAYEHTQIHTEECYLDDTDSVICFTDGEDEDAISLWFTMGDDDLIKSVSMER